MLLTELRERLVNFEFDNVVEYAKEFSDKYATQNFDVRDTIRKRSRILKIYLYTCPPRNWTPESTSAMCTSGTR